VLNIAFSAPETGSNAASGYALLNGSSISEVVIENAGSGYSTAPTVLPPQAVANPASLFVVSEAIFQLTTNTAAVWYRPLVANGIAPDTQIVNTLTTTNADYTAGDTETAKLYNFSIMKRQQILLSEKNRFEKSDTRFPTALRVEMSTTNKNTSPMISLSENPRLQAISFIINNPADINNPNDPNSELHPTGGNCLSRYITKQFKVDKGVGVRVYVNAVSAAESSFDVYFRSSRTGFVLSHTEQPWTKMYCDTARNLSKTADDFLDYNFYLLNIEQFDQYDLKITMKSSNKAVVPTIANYRAIILAE
jgi:hypothetical protein